MPSDTVHTILFMLPVLTGVLLLWVMRRDRRRQFIQNRLNAFKGGEEATPRVSLERLRRAASRGAILPQRLRLWLDKAFEAAGNSIRIIHLVIAGLAAAVIVTEFAKLILALNPGLVLLLGFGAAAAAPAVLLRFAQARYQRRFLDLFPDALDMIGRSIRAGLPVNEALAVTAHEIAHPVGNELRRVLDQVQLGLQMIDALEKTADRIRVADFRFMVVALALQQKTGGSLAETLANLSSVIRARKALRLKARALSAEAKVSAMVLAALPFLICGALYVMNRDLARSLFVDPRGRFMVGVAFISLTAGLTTMYVMIKRAVR